MTGKELYEKDLKRQPVYHDGTPRKVWGELNEVQQFTWNRGARKLDEKTRTELR